MISYRTPLLSTVAGLTVATLLAGNLNPAVAAPSHVHPGHVHPGHVHPGRVIVPVQVPGNTYVTTPLQTERYLRVSNQSGQTMTVFVQTPNASAPLAWTFEPGQTSDLTVEGGQLSASQVRIWATSDRSQWNTNKDADLLLVGTPYRSESLGTFTYTFNP